MNFFIQMIPPTATAQEKQVHIVHGRPVFYDPPKVKKARSEISEHLLRVKPEDHIAFTTALELRTIWLFPKGKHKNGEWKTTRPDTDNLQKMLKDCMTQTGYWKDDALVVREIVEKRWSDEPTGIYIEINEL